MRRNKYIMGERSRTYNESRPVDITKVPEAQVLVTLKDSEFNRYKKAVESSFTEEDAALTADLDIEKVAAAYEDVRTRAKTDAENRATLIADQYKLSDAVKLSIAQESYDKGFADLVSITASELYPQEIDESGKDKNESSRAHTMDILTMDPENFNDLGMRWAASEEVKLAESYRDYKELQDAKAKEREEEIDQAVIELRNDPAFATTNAVLKHFKEIAPGEAEPFEQPITHVSVNRVTSVNNGVRTSEYQRPGEVEQGEVAEAEAEADAEDLNPVVPELNPTGETINVGDTLTRTDRKGNQYTWTVQEVNDDDIVVSRVMRDSQGNIVPGEENRILTINDRRDSFLRELNSDTPSIIEDDEFRSLEASADQPPLPPEAPDFFVGKAEVAEVKEKKKLNKKLLFLGAAGLGAAGLTIWYLKDSSGWHDAIDRIKDLFTGPDVQRGEFGLKEAVQAAPPEVKLEDLVGPDVNIEAASKISKGEGFYQTITELTGITDKAQLKDIMNEVGPSLVDKGALYEDNSDKIGGFGINLGYNDGKFSKEDLIAIAQAAKEVADRAAEVRNAPVPQ